MTLNSITLLLRTLHNYIKHTHNTSQFLCNDLHSLLAASAIIALSRSNVIVNASYSYASDINDEECHALIAEGDRLVNTSPGCRLVKALLDDEDIMGGSAEDVAGVRSYTQ